jgi:hypothetical protein
VAKPFKGKIDLDFRDSQLFHTDEDRSEAHDLAVQHLEELDELEELWPEIRTMVSRYSLCGQGLCMGDDGGDAVSSEYQPKFEFSGGKIVKVVFDIADDAYLDVEREMAAALARD